MPQCPSCDGDMVQRTNRIDGTKFWGCKNYPTCKGIVQLEEEDEDLVPTDSLRRNDKRRWERE